MKLQLIVIFEETKCVGLLRNMLVYMIKPLNINALVNRLLNADESDHSRKLLLSANPKVRMKGSDSSLLVMFSTVLPNRLVVQP